jgi:hypothetical protein
MIFQGIVENGVVRLPPEAALPDGTFVRIEASRQKRFAELMDVAGTWQGDDAESDPDHTNSVLVARPYSEPKLAQRTRVVADLLQGDAELFAEDSPHSPCDLVVTHADGAGGT